MNDRLLNEYKERNQLNKYYLLGLLLIVCHLCYLIIFTLIEFDKQQTVDSHSTIISSQLYYWLPEMLFDLINVIFFYYYCILLIPSSNNTLKFSTIAVNENENENDYKYEYEDNETGNDNQIELIGLKDKQDCSFTR